MKRAALLLIFIAACTLTPNQPGSIHGTIRDRSGVPLPGVTVTLHSASGDRTTVTNPRGEYEFTAVAPGKYEIQASLSGFTQIRSSVSVAEGRAVRKDATLGYGAVAEAITVTAASPSSRIGAAIGSVFGGIVGTKSQAVSFVAPSPEPTPSTANYAAIAENGFVDTRKERTTTFSIDVDGASYANVRRFLNSNLVPPPDAVRVEEMINYFTYNYAPPSDGRPFSVVTEVAGCPWESSHRLLRIGIQGKTTDQWKLAPNNLVFLLDVSGSMQPPERLPLIKSAFRLLVDQLRAEAGPKSGRFSDERDFGHHYRGLSQISD